MGLEAVQVLWTVASNICDRSIITENYQNMHVTTTFAMKDLRNTKHPLVIWTGLCYGNFTYVAKYAVAIFAEYKKRFNRDHVRSHDASWFLENAGGGGFIRFGTEKHKIWLSKMKEWVEANKAGWWKIHGLPDDQDPTSTAMTEFVQCVPEECQTTRGQVVSAYRKCMISKFSTMKKMRYYYTQPPEWFPEEMQKRLIMMRIERQKRIMK
jgi:hypothetical protein